MNDTGTTVHLASGQRVVVDGTAAAMIEQLAEHRDDVNRHEAGCVELHFVPGSVKVMLRVDLRGRRRKG